MPNPDIYRPSVGIMLLNQDNMVFMAKKTENIGTNKDFWQMPQGGIEGNEDPATALKRELAEETGVSVEDTDVVASINEWLYYDVPKEIISSLWEGKYVGQRQRWFLLKARGEPQINLNVANEASPEFYKYTWKPINKVIDSSIWFRHKIYRQVIDAFKQHIAV